MDSCFPKNAAQTCQPKTPLPGHRRAERLFTTLMKKEKIISVEKKLSFGLASQGYTSSADEEQVWGFVKKIWQLLELSFYLPVCRIFSLLVWPLLLVEATVWLIWLSWTDWTVWLCRLVGTTSILWSWRGEGFHSLYKLLWCLVVLAVMGDVLLFAFHTLCRVFTVVLITAELLTSLTW